MTDTPYPTDTKRQAGQSTRACPTCGLNLSVLVNQCPQDGTRLPPAFENDATFKHKYEFLDTIGSGGMGVIYKARQLAMNKIVAIKMLHAEVPSDDAMRRFQIEGQTGSLLKHKYIIQIYDLGLTESGRPFMIMDYLQGKTLAQELAAHGTLAEERFVRLFLQVADALSHAHSKGVLHRDLKPSNLMLVQDNGVEEVRIMDFGIAKLLDGTEFGAQQLTKTGEALGSPLYMSPEQCRPGKIDRRADLYSLGCVMYESLTGAPPFIGSTSLETLMMHLERQPLGLSNASLGREIDQGLQDIVMRLLQKVPADRYQSADELETDLLKYQDATFGGKRIRFVYEDQGDKSNKPKPRLRPKTIGALLALAVLVAAGIGLSLYMRLSPKTDHASSARLADTIITVWDDPKLKEWIASRVRAQERDLELSKFVGQVFAATNEDLEPLRNATNAEKITLPKSARINDAGLQYIKDLRLKVLDITETSVQKLTPLKKMDSLLTLDASKTRLDSDGMRIIGGLRHLENLYITHTAIQDSDLESLKNLHSLKNLNLTDCSHITESGVQRLHNYLPNAQITRESEPSAREVAGKAATEADQLFQNQKYAQAETKYARILANLSEQPIPNNKAMAVFLKKRADCCRVLKQYSRADQYYSQAKDLIRQADAPLVFARILDGQAISAEAQFANNHDRNLLNKAIQAREKSISIYDEFHRYNLGQLDEMRVLACDYSLINELDKAIRILQKSIDLYKKTKNGDSQPAGWSTNVLADILTRQSKWQEAETDYKATYAIYRLNEKAMDPLVFPRLETSIALCEFELKHYDKAEAMLTRLLAQNGKDKNDRLRQLDLIRQTVRAENKLEQAQALDKQFFDLYKQLKKATK